MNERIQELAKSVQCERHWTEEDIEKFAELIIRECMEQVRDEVQYQYDWKLADAVTKRVMEHFGV